MLLRNDLLRYGNEEDRMVRILWLSADSAGAAIIDTVEEKALPEIVSVETLMHDIQEKRAWLVSPDPHLVLAAETTLLESHKLIRKNAWATIRDLVEAEPDIYIPGRRGGLLKAAVAEHKVTLPTLYRYLRRYWQRGQTPNALLPDYANSGGRGKERKLSGKKRGRPRIYGEQDGINVTPDIRRVFRVAIDRCYAQEKSKFTFQGAYDEMIRTFFSERQIDPETGRIVHIPKNDYVAEDFPTVAQFRYWSDKGENALDCQSASNIFQLSSSKSFQLIKGISGRFCVV